MVSDDLRGRLLNPWLQLAFCVLISTVAEIFLKLGADATAQPGSEWGWTGLPGLQSVWVWAGIAASIVSLFTWLGAIRRLPLTIAFPFGNAVYILVPLSSWIFLGEHISARRWAGIALVLLGLLLIAQPAAKLEERL